MRSRDSTYLPARSCFSRALATSAAIRCTSSLWTPASAARGAGSPCARAAAITSDRVDGFGNLVTNLKPPIRPMKVHNHYVTASATTYAEARMNEPFVYLGSMGYLEIGVRESRADRMLGARSGMKVELL